MPDIKPDTSHFVGCGWHKEFQVSCHSCLVVTVAKLSQIVSENLVKEHGVCGHEGFVTVVDGVKLKYGVEVKCNRMKDHASLHSNGLTEWEK